MREDRRRDEEAPAETIRGGEFHFNAVTIDGARYAVDDRPSGKNTALSFTGWTRSCAPRSLPEFRPVKGLVT